MNSKVRSPKYVIELAKKMRVNLTIPEKILWEKFKTKKIEGHRFRIQHPIHRYILDFYCHEKIFNSIHILIFFEVPLRGI